MNIAHLLPYSVTFPLTKHNGRYEWALRFATLQAQQGHTVTIYCAPGSSSDRPALHWRSLPEDQGDKTANNTALMDYAFTNTEHDIYHSHFDSLHYAEADKTDKPIIVTQHWFPHEGIAEAVPLNTRKNVLAVPVTEFMRRADQRMHIPCSKVIYHGIDLEQFTISPAKRSDRLLFVGRITPQKGVLESIQMVIDAKGKLDIVGKIQPKDQAYWDSILPLVDGENIRYLGAKTHVEVAQLLSAAKAMLFFPQDFEAFGQTIIEAQACGTPVILNNLGANSELIQPDVTGCIVDSPENFFAALEKVASLDHNACRLFAQNFNQYEMARKYEKLYNSLLCS